MRLLAVAAACLSACSHSASEPISESDLCDDVVVSSRLEHDVKHEGLALTVALYKRMAKSETGGFVFSPFGVRSALALTSVGARGETASELAEALHAKDGTTRAWHKKFRSGQAQVLCPQGERSRRIEFANGLFLQDGAALKDAFVASLQRTYAAAPLEADFRNDAGDARESIDSWINRQTRG
jgi:serpin B